jgi:hypothetical protein
MEENSSQDNRQIASPNPEGITQRHAPPREIPTPESVVGAQQTDVRPTADAPKRLRAIAAGTIENDLSKFERRILSATWAGVAAAAITGFVIYSQFRVMTDQTQILGAQTTSAVADSIESGRRVEKQLAIAQQQASAAQDSVKAIRRQMQQDQRAWINVSSGNVNFAENQPITIPVISTNSGKTPAREFVADFIVKLVQIEKSPILDFHHVAVVRESSGAIFKDQQFAFPAVSLRNIPRSRGAEPHALSKSEFEDLKSGKTYIVIYGRIAYEDIFKTRHWVHFCSFSSPSGKPVPAKNCTSYNDIDND